METKISNLFTLIIICIVPLIITPWSIDYYYHPKIMSIYFLCLLMMIFYMVKIRTIIVEKENSDYFLLSYIFIILISTLFSVDLILSIQGNSLREEGFAALSCYAFIYIIAAKYYKFSRKHIKYLILSSCIIALYGVFQYLGYEIIRPDFIRKYWHKHSYSTIGNRNFLGSYLVLMLPISIYSYLHSKKNILLFSSCLLYLCLLCTITRGAWIGFTASICLLSYYVFKYKINIKRFAIVAGLFVSITVLFNIYSGGEIFNRAASIGKDFGDVIKYSSNSAGSHRVFIWKGAIKLIGDRPFLGSGPDTFGEVFMDKFQKEIKDIYNNSVSFDKAHNEYLQIAVTTGIPSLLLYIAFIMTIMAKLHKMLEKNKIIVPIYCCIVGYLVQAFFNISVVSVAPVFWAILGVGNKFCNSIDFNILEKI